MNTIKQLTMIEIRMFRAAKKTFRRAVQQHIDYLGQEIANLQDTAETSGMNMICSCQERINLTNERLNEAKQILHIIETTK